MAEWAVVLASSVLPSFVLLLFVQSFLPSYFSEKAKNLATKEDIGVITEKVEGIRSIYAKELETLKALQQLRSASLDRRLQAHQEAYTLWRKAFSLFIK